MSTTFTYDQVRKYEHSTLGDSKTRFDRDGDAFMAGAQNALDRLLARLSGMECVVDVVFIEGVAADVLSDIHHGELA